MELWISASIVEPTLMNIMKITMTAMSFSLDQSPMASQLQAERRIYYNEVTNYNNKICVVPSNIVAKVFVFKEENLFEIEEYKRENINIKLED